jgi:ABC-type nitrate/sulfonate/bicarbonate transport system substrate-binding protein
LEVTLAGAAELTTAPLFVADALGFFSDEGLDVEFIPAGGGGNAAAVLLSGDAGLGSFTASHAYAAAAEGGKMPIIAPLAVGFQGLFFMVNGDVAAERGLDPDAPLEERLQNLEGLTIGISSPGSTTDNLARLVAAEAGLDPDSQLEIVPLGGVPDATTAMVDGRVDAAISVLPISAGAEADGAIVLFDYGSDFESLNTVIFSAVLANNDWLNENRDVAVRFLTAVARALDAIDSDPSAAYGAAYEPYFAEAVPDRTLYDASWPR